jgi:hypothetical protein
MNKEKYDLAFFIKKFSATLESKWCVGQYSDGEGRFCVMGHCGVRSKAKSTREAIALRKLAGNAISFVNDGVDTWHDIESEGKPYAKADHLPEPPTFSVVSLFGDTPKKRVVNYLKYLSIRTV